MLQKRFDNNIIISTISVLFYHFFTVSDSVKVVFAGKALPSFEPIHKTDTCVFTVGLKQSEAILEAEIQRRKQG